MAVPEDDLHWSVEGDVFRWDFMRGRGGWHLATLSPEAGTAQRVGRCHLSSARALPDSLRCILSSACKCPCEVRPGTISTNL